MDHYEKYQKYKRKYLELVKTSNSRQSGGSSFPLNDEIHFWGRQLMEHCYFLYLGLEDTNQKGDKHMVLKKSAGKLCEKWKLFLNKNFYSKGITVTPETVFLTREDLVKVSDINMAEVNKLIDETDEFTSGVVDILNGGDWIGWIFPGLAEHMVKETRYFKRKINNQPYSPDEEIAFCNEHHSEEMGATAQLINPDPAQQKIIDIVRSYAMKKMSVLKAGGSLSGSDAAAEPFPSQWTAVEEAALQGADSEEKANILVLSIRYGEELSKFAEDTGNKIEARPPQLKSVISPVLAHHVHREFVRFTATLKALQG